jgi:23S rRNA (cytidine1920-2'-O)/16S rRNA (cytidine1409-2'-O)-methyltransferase
MVSRGLSSTRAQAKSLIEMDRVQVNGIFVKKAGLMVGDEDELVVNSPDYVGRGAFKLEAAIREFQLNVLGLRMIDVGSSTGGFTEILLRSGACEVLAVDVGTDQMVSKLKDDPRVISREGTHILDVVVDEPYDGAVIDLSFISISKVIAHIKTLLKDTGFCCCLD